MQARFLLGPAGSGKTFRCLAEVRAALKKDPEGKPLILLAPKQATFQIERQLLADDSLNGYSRLHIFSFERLARFILDELRVTPPKFLSDEGRVMVLRALLIRHANELKLFRASARRPGFAQELGRLLNELLLHQLTPAKLRSLAHREDLSPTCTPNSTTSHCFRRTMRAGCTAMNYRTKIICSISPLKRLVPAPPFVIHNSQFMASGSMVLRK